MSKEINIQIKDMNNKSRKGKYIYIKKSGVRGSYYKMKPGVKVDDMVRRYKRLYITKSKKVTKAETRYLKKIRKRGKISQHITRGLSKTVIQDVLTAGAGETKTAIDKLLKPLVKDKQIREILGTEENLNKLITRFEYRVKLFDEAGKELMEFNKFNNTPQRQIVELQNTLKGESVEEDYEYNRLLEKLKLIQAENINTKNYGKIAKARLTIIFRR